MAEFSLEQELTVFDYSVFSAARDSLLEEILNKHRRDNRNAVASFPRGFRGLLMSEDELDCVAAAGVNNIMPNRSADNLESEHGLTKPFSSGSSMFGEK